MYVYMIKTAQSRSACISLHVHVRVVGAAVALCTCTVQLPRNYGSLWVRSLRRPENKSELRDFLEILRKKITHCDKRKIAALFANSSYQSYYLLQNLISQLNSPCNNHSRNLLGGFVPIVSVICG